MLGAIDEEPDPDNDMASAEETGDKLSIRLQIYEGRYTLLLMIHVTTG